MSNSARDGRGRTTVLYFHANNYDVGGSDLCLLKLVTELDRERYEPIVVLRLATRVVDLYRQHGIRVVVLPLVRFSRGQDLWYWLRFLPALVSSAVQLGWLIRREEVDIVHSNDLLDFLGSFVGLVVGCATVQHVRMFPPSGRLGRLIRRLVISLNHRVLCVSRAIHDALGGPDNGRVLHDWLDPGRVGHDSGRPEVVRADLGVPSERKVVGVVGRLDPWKGQHLLVAAAPLILDALPEVEFWIVGGEVSGKESYSESVKSLVRERGLSGRVRLMGERHDVIALMSAMDLVVHTSVEPDPLPGVVMEAGYAGRVVVGPRAGGVPEEVPQSNWWALYEAGDAVSLAAAVIRALKRADLVSDGCAAREFVLDRFSPGPIVAQLEAVYEEALRR